VVIPLPERIPQFTCIDFVERWQAEKIKIGWSGKKRCFGNILVERLWRILKYEQVHLWADSNGLEAEPKEGSGPPLSGTCESAELPVGARDSFHWRPVVQSFLGLARFLWRYSHVRHHSALAGKTPDKIDAEIKPCSSCPELRRLWKSPQRHL